jgi:KUP system potassium uptake protein
LLKEQNSNTIESASFSRSLIKYIGTIGWHCQKQDIDAAALSTTEAKYRACSETGQDIHWLEQLLLDIHPYLGIQDTTDHLYCNNQGALALLQNTQYQHRTRHINVCHHWLCHYIKRKTNFSVSYVQTDNNQADFLTKPLVSASVMPRTRTF